MPAAPDSQALAFRHRRRGLWLFAAVWLLMALLVEGLLRSGVGAFQVGLVEDLCRCVTILTATGLLAWRTHRSGPALRPLWAGLTLAHVCLGLATLYLIITMDLLHLGAPVTTFRHAGYFGAMLCLTWSVWQLPTQFFLPTQRLQTVLDGLVISLAIFFMAWGALLRAMVAANRSPGNFYGLTLAYCLFSIALGALWLFQESRLPRMRLGPTGWLLRLGLGIMLVWWLFYAIGNIQGWYRSFGLAQRSDVLFSFRYLCFGLAALWPAPDLQPETRAALRDRPTILPYLPAVTGMGYGAWRLLTGQSLDATMVVAGVLLGGVLTVRHYLTVRDLDGLSLELERRVQARTDEVVRIQMELMKVQRTRLIAGMAAGFAHDFKNMLTIIRNWADLMRDEADPAFRVRGLAAIDKATDTAQDLIQEVLAAGRIQELAPQSFDLGEHLRAQRPALEGTLGGRACLTLALPETALPVFLDPAKFDQALVNLTANAAEAMGQAGSFTLRAWQDPVEPYAMLEASDTGSGIEPDLLERIFEPFFTTKPIGRGTGLGLSSVQGTILQSGGTMTVRSDLGSGTTFTLRLPQR